jgi:hypothetical protein
LASNPGVGAHAIDQRHYSIQYDNTKPTESPSTQDRGKKELSHSKSDVENDQKILDFECIDGFLYASKSGVNVGHDNDRPG